MVRRVLVIGATGLLGEPVARRLQESEYGVRVLTRDAGRARTRFPRSFEVVEGDALRRTDLDTALADCDAVHISIDHDREDECVAHIVEAARNHGLEHITYVSGTTVCEENRWFPPVVRKLKAEETIRASGIAYTIFCPGWFMEMLSRFIRGHHALVFGRMSRRWHFVSVQEFARMVVESYRRPEAAGKRLYVHGPQALTVAEALRTYCRVLHPDIGTIRRVPFWLMRLIARLTGNSRMRSGVDIVSYLERVGERGDAAEANAILGAPRIGLEEWLEMQKSGATM